MKLKIAFNYLLFLFIIPFSAQAQSYVECADDLPSEKVIMQLDRSLYITGETIWFKAHCVVDESLPGPISQILYLEIFNSQEKVFVQEKYLLEEGRANGAIILPEELRSGYYYLRAYTQYMRNFPVETFEYHRLAIVNPDLAPASVVKNESNKAPRKVDTKRLAIPISITQSSFNTRSPVEVTVKNPVAEAITFSVSVRQLGLEESRVDFPGSKQSQQNKLTWMPEIRGLSVSGVVKDKASQNPVAQALVSAGIVGEKEKINLQNSHTDGSFTLPISNLYGTQNLFLDVKNDKTSELEVLVKNDFSTEFPDIKTKLLQFDSSQHQLFEQLFLQQQLDQRFKSTKLSTTQDIPSSSQSFGMPDKTIILKDFIQLPNMEEVFREIIPSISVRGKLGNRFLNIYDDLSKRSYNDPLVLLDQIPVNNIETLLALDPRLVEKIALSYSEYQLGDYTIGGRISIHTSTNNFAGYQWKKEAVFLEFRGLSPVQTFTPLTYTNANDRRQPDFRSVLYWNPAITLDREKQFSFYTSDHAARYEIIVQGTTANGTIYRGRQEFEVKK